MQVGGKEGRLYRCEDCEEYKGREAFRWYRSKQPGKEGLRRQGSCVACRSSYGDHGKQRQEQRRADYRNHLERLRRNRTTLEPCELAELWGGCASHATAAARAMGFEDVIDGGWSWDGGRIRAEGVAANVAGFWKGET